MKKLISLIIPAYNIEGYISACLQSVINQTYKNLQIIVINDGSTDETLSICTKFKDIDSRIQIINQENQGLSAARNNALAMAEGDYIGFVDGDDQISSNMYEKMYDNICNQNADICMCNFYCLKENGNISLPQTNFNISENLVVEGEDKLKTIIYHNNMFVWNKLYKKYLFDNVSFPVGKTYEDAFVIPNVVNKANKLATISDCLYYYTVRKNSITHAPFSLGRIDMFYANKSVYDYILKLNNYDNELKKVCCQRLFLSFYNCVNSALKNGSHYMSSIEQMIDSIKEYNVIDCGLDSSTEKLIKFIISDVDKYARIYKYITDHQLN